MKRYKMASVLTPNITKQPLRYIEVPLNKFSEEVIPHHQKVYKQYKATIQKLVSVENEEQIKREVKEKKRTIKQLRDLMYELDTLRTQVEDEDLDAFDMRTLSFRKIIINLINGYTELEKAADKGPAPQSSSQIRIFEDTDKENFNPFEGASQLQVKGSIEELKLKECKSQLHIVENINKDVEDLHEMYKDLNEMLVPQGEHVDQIEEAVESTQQNVEMGTKNIIKAHKLKAVAYPVTGAFIGGMIGGPIGLVAGIKVGGIAALSCAIAGYTGGKWFKKAHSPENIKDEPEREADIQTIDDTSQKKDI